MTTALLAPSPAPSSPSPELTRALGALMDAYMPTRGATPPAMYADWFPAHRDWPDWLAALHGACVDARRAWRLATQADMASADAGRPDGQLGTAATLAGVAYFAIERTAREALAAWAGERIEARGAAAPTVEGRGNVQR